jgi:hypothetical protein
VYGTGLNITKHGGRKADRMGQDYKYFLSRFFMLKPVIGVECW